MATYHDDNFGRWEDMDDPENRAFYQRVQRTNIKKICQGCQRTVNLQPQYAYCNECADKIERGEDLSG